MLILTTHEPLETNYVRTAILEQTLLRNQKSSARQTMERKISQSNPAYYTLDYLK